VADPPGRHTVLRNPPVAQFRADGEQLVDRPSENLLQPSADCRFHPQVIDIVSMFTVNGREVRQLGSHYAEHKRPPVVGMHDVHLFGTEQPDQAGNPAQVYSCPSARQHMNADIRSLQAL
jgi:hypothetical protein